MTEMISISKEDFDRLAERTAELRDSNQRLQEELAEHKRTEQSLALTNFALSNVQEAVFLIDENAHFHYVNEESCRILGYTRDELLGMSVPDIDPDYPWKRWPFIREDLKTHRSITFESHHKTKDGRVFPVEIGANYFDYDGESYILALVRDITERKRVEEQLRKEAERGKILLELYEKSPQLSDKQLYDYALEHVVRLTDSTIGFLHLVSDDQKYVILTAWNSEALKTCYDTHYSIEEAGNWVDCVRFARPVVYNDFARSPNQKGLPEGHSPLHRFMSIPVMEDDKVRIIFGVGNKTEDYDDQDVVCLQLVANELHKIIKQRHSEQEQRESEEQYRELVNTIQAAVVVHNADTRISICNSVALELLGLAEDQMLGKAAVDPAWHFFHEDGTVMHPDEYPVNQVIATHQPLRNLILIVHRPGKDDDVWVLVNADPVIGSDGEISQVIVTFVDITERKQIEEERLANLHFFESMDQVNRAIQGASDLEQMMSDVLDVTLSIFDCDRAWLLYPSDPQAASYRVPMERTRPEYPGALKLGVEIPIDAETAELLRVSSASTGPVSTHPIPTDVKKRFNVQSQIIITVYPKTGKPWMFGLHQCSYPRVWTPEEERLFQDIGRRLSDALSTLLAYRDLRESEENYRQLSERLQKANRALTTLSNVNQALIHATEESTLLDEVCKIAVETGGYRMAWIGYAENDPDKTVRPVAFAGYEAGLFQAIKVSWADTELGRGPMGMAIRTGKPVFVSDIAADPSFEPWRRQAEERGYTSCISVPLSNEAGVFGALILYGSMPDEFEEEEIRLLIELAGDLSYGITSLRTGEKRRQAEEALWESSQMLKLVLDNMPAFVFWKDRKSVYLGCNYLFAANAGLAFPEDIIGKTDLDLPWKYDEAESYRADDRQVMESGVPKLNYEETQHTVDGRVTWVRTSKIPLRNAEGDVIGVLGTFEDITERKEAEEALRYSAEKYRKLYESLMDGFALSDMEGKILEFNRPYVQMLGYSDEELRNLTYSDITPVQWREHERDIVEKEVLERGYSETFEKEYRRKDGKIIPVELRKHLLRDDEGNPIGMWSVVRDISERRRTEEEKRQFYRETIRSVTEGRLEIGDRDAVSPYQAVSDFTKAFKTASELSSTRQLVESYCSSKGLQGDVLGLFTTGVGEALTNAVKHAHGGEVFCGASSEELWVGISDAGPGIATLTLPAATLKRGYSTKASMGMGYSIMLDVSDRVLLCTGPDGTTVILIKTLGQARPAASLEDIADIWDAIRPA
ncbi:MAG: PAS domain S-box protein [Armatimonadota bacterium]